MNREQFGPGGQYSVRSLEPPDIAALQRLFEATADFFELTTGSAPGPDEGQRAFVAGPPTKAVNDKRTIGVFHLQATLVGVLDAIVDWPAVHEWTIGLLLLHPDHRGAGLGASVLSAFETWAEGEGARVIRSAVVTKHTGGITFFERAGYRRTSEGAGPTPGLSIVHFEKPLR